MITFDIDFTGSISKYHSLPSKSIVYLVSYCNLLYHSSQMYPVITTTYETLYCFEPQNYLIATHKSISNQILFLNN
jgi:hypothetical protein